MLTAVPCPTELVTFTEAAALANNPIDGGEPQSGSFADLFCRKERLKDLGPHGFRHAVPVVDYGELHVAARLHFPDSRGTRFGDADDGGANDQATAARHGIASVGHQVHDRLFELALIGSNQLHRIGELEHDFNVGFEQAPYQRLHLHDYAVDVEELGPHDLLATKGEQLPHELRGPTSGVATAVSGGSIASSARSFSRAVRYSR